MLHCRAFRMHVIAELVTLLHDYITESNVSQAESGGNEMWKWLCVMNTWHHRHHMRYASLLHWQILYDHVTAGWSCDCREDRTLLSPLLQLTAGFSFGIHSHLLRRSSIQLIIPDTSAPNSFRMAAIGWVYMVVKFLLILACLPVVQLTC